MTQHLTPQQREEVLEVLKRHIVVDATGLAPAVVGHYITGFEEALTAALPLLRRAHFEEAAQVAETIEHRSYDTGEVADDIARAIRALAEEAV